MPSRSGSGSESEFESESGSELDAIVIANTAKTLWSQYSASLNLPRCSYAREEAQRLLSESLRILRESADTRCENGDGFVKREESKVIYLFSRAAVSPQR